MMILEAPKGVLRHTSLAKPVTFCKITGQNGNNNPTECPPVLGLSPLTEADLSTINPPINPIDSHYNTSQSLYKRTKQKIDKSNEIKRLKRLKSLVGAVAYIHESQLISGLYLSSDHLTRLLKQHGKKFLLLCGGLGIGKSTALAAMMRDLFGGKGVAICHRVGLTRQLSSVFDADYYQDVKKQGGELSSRVATTVHSLPEMLHIERSSAAFNGGLLVLDESNSIAAEIAGDMVKNEALALASIGKAATAAAAVVCADAHLDESTINLLIAAGVNPADMLLVVVVKEELKGYAVNIVEDERDQNGKSLGAPALMNQILSDLMRGEKVICTSLSKTFLEMLDREAVKAGITSKILITGDTDEHTKSALTADSYQDFQLVMISPSMSTGISFHRTISENGTVIPCPSYKHADKSYVVLANGADTGTHQDGLQAMLRERLVNGKNITCLYQPSQNPLPASSQVAKSLNHQINSIYEAIQQSYGLAEAARLMARARPHQSAAETFLIQQATKHADDKLNFLPEFVAECQAKGAIVAFKKLSDFVQGDVTPESIKAEKQRMRDEWVEARVTAIKPSNYDDLDATDKANKPIFDRRYVEEQAAVNFDDLEPVEAKEWIDRILPDKNKRSVLSTVREWERAYSDRNLLKQVINAAILGISAADDDRIRFLEKTTTSKAHWLARAHYGELLLKAAGVVEVGGEWLVLDDVTLTDKSIKQNDSPAKAIYAALMKNPNPAIQCGLLPTDTAPEEVKRNPLMSIVEMMEAIGIKLKKARKQASYTPCREHLELHLGMMNRRRDAGINDLAKRVELFNEYIKKYGDRKAMEQNRDFENKRAAPDDVIEAIQTALDEHGYPELLDEMVAFLEPFHDRIRAKQLSRIAVSILVERGLFSVSD